MSPRNPYPILYVQMPYHPVRVNKLTLKTLILNEYNARESNFIAQKAVYVQLNFRLFLAKFFGKMRVRID